jgi:hypothetical protein
VGSAQEDECGKAFVGLVVSRRDSPELFEIAEEVFDEMPPAIHGEVACNGLLSIRLWRDDDFRFGFLKQVAQVIVVEALVGQKCLHIDAVDQVRRGNAVVTLAWQENEPGEVAERIDKGDDLRRQTTAGAADGLMASPPLWMARPSRRHQCMMPVFKRGRSEPCI